MPRVGSTQRPGTPVLEQPKTLQPRQQPRHLALVVDLRMTRGIEKKGAPRPRVDETAALRDRGYYNTRA